MTTLLYHRNFKIILDEKVINAIYSSPFHTFPNYNNSIHNVMTSNKSCFCLMLFGKINYTYKGGTFARIWNETIRGLIVLHLMKSYEFLIIGMRVINDLLLWPAMMK